MDYSTITLLNVSPPIHLLKTFDTCTMVLDPRLPNFGYANENEPL